jgi:hypothetical protein
LRERQKPDAQLLNKENCMGKDEMDLLPVLAEASPPMQAAALPDELQEEPSPLEKIKQADAAREGFPGEHWLVLAIGIGVWQVTRKHRNFLVRTAGGFAAAALVARAASGRAGLSKVLRYTPFGGRIDRCPPCDAQQRHSRS